MGENMFNNCNAVIFDLDGTLWDARDCCCEIWNRVFDKHEEVNVRMTQELSSRIMGKTMEEIGDLLFPEFPVAKRRAMTDEVGVEEVVYLQ